MSERPNVLFIMSDQHHADCMSMVGKRNVRTPNLDKLAGEGVRFEMAYSNNPICSPSRVCFHTGQYCHTHGMLGNSNFQFEGMPDEDTVSMRFRKYGYQTALVGKAHMVKKWDYAGYEHIRYCDLCDTDMNDVLSNHYYKYLVEHGLADDFEDGALPKDHPYNENEYGIAKLPFEHTNERWTGDETLAFLKDRDRDRPFFAHMSFERPHPNFLISEELKDMYNPDDIELPESVIDAWEHEFSSKPEVVRKSLMERMRDKDHLKKILAAYYTLITVIDAEIGRVVDYLNENGEYENTIIVYSADHGDFAGDHGVFRKNIGIYESVHRIPFIIKYPRSPVKVIENSIIESIDLYPTLCELCSVPVPEALDGSSILPVIEGKSPGKEHALSEWDSFRDDDSMVNAIRTSDYRLTYHGSQYGGGELYHNSQDPGEIFNLWNDPQYSDVKIELLQKLLDNTTPYAKRTNFTTGLAINAETRHCPSSLVHKQAKKWSELNSVCYSRNS